MPFRSHVVSIMKQQNINCYTEITKHNVVMFQAWPDHGVPEDPVGVLSFIEDINRRMIKNSQDTDAPEQVGTSLCE